MLISAIANALGSILLAMVLWEVVKTGLYGAFTALLLRALGFDLSAMRPLWEHSGWPGVATFGLLYIILAVRRVERHVGKYEDRILGKGARQ